MSPTLQNTRAQRNAALARSSSSIGLISAIGTKRTYRVALHMSAFGGKADMTFLRCERPLMAQSGHRWPLPVH